MEWKDTTSYERGKRGEIDPRSWTLADSSPPIVVHRHIHFPKDQWMLSVNRIGIDLKPLSSTDIEEAKIEAVAFVREYLRAMLARVPGAHTPDGEAVADARQIAEQDAEFRKSIAGKTVRVVRAVVFEGDGTDVLAQIARSLSVGLHAHGCWIRVSQSPIEIVD